MHKYQIEIRICPVVENDEGQKVIKTEKPVKKYLSQGEGFDFKSCEGLIKYSRNAVEILRPQMKETLLIENEFNNQ